MGLLLRRRLLCLSTLLVVVPTALSADAVRLRLSGPGNATSDVPDDAALSPDGEWAVYRVDAPSDGIFRLFAVRRQGTERHELAFSPPGASIESFRISGDSRRVVYLAEILSTGAREVWSVPIAGPAAAVRMSPEWTAGDGADSFAVSGDSNRVVVLGEFAAAGVSELWSSPILGPSGSAVRLHPVPVPGGDVDDVTISADGASVVFFGDVGQDERPELWSVPIAGPGASAVRLSGAVPVGATMGGVSYRITPDGSRVVYTGQFQTAGVVELWSSAIGVAGRIKLSPAALSGGGVRSHRFEITADGARVVFFGDLRVDERLEIWSAPVAGPAGSAVRVSPTPVAGGSIHNADPFVLSPDGAWLAMHGDLETVDASELWRVPIAGPATAAVKVNPEPVPGGAIPVGEYAISPDSEHLVFRGDLLLDGETTIWSAPRDGAPGESYDLAGNFVPGGDVGHWEITADSSRVVFRGDLLSDDRTWLFSRAIDGSGSRELISSELLPEAEAEVGDFVLSPDGREVAYLADPNVTGNFELYLRRTDGAAGFERLSGPSPTFLDVETPRFSPEGRGVFYRADAGFPGAFQLWIADYWIFADDFDEGNTDQWSHPAL